jgi:hypothetical protein
MTGIIDNLLAALKLKGRSSTKVRVFRRRGLLKPYQAKIGLNGNLRSRKLDFEKLFSKSTVF